jgi:hypothetical protein
MLLTILIATDAGLGHSPRLAGVIDQLFGRSPCWEGQYEVRPAHVGADDLRQAADYLVVNSLLAQRGDVAACQGRYVWILPSFADVDFSLDTAESMFDLLSMGATALAFDQAGTGSNKSELQHAAAELLPVHLQGEEFRFILRRDAMLDCFGTPAADTTTLAFLAAGEADARRSMYARVYGHLKIVPGIAASAFYSLCLSYYSGTRPWEREVIMLPRSLRSGLAQHGERAWAVPGRIDGLRHFLFSACSAIESLFPRMFRDGGPDGGKAQAFALAYEVLDHMEALVSSLQSAGTLVLPVKQLGFFVRNWNRTAAPNIGSANVLTPGAQRGVFDGVWWLGSDLKDELNRLGEARCQELVSALRMAVETSRLSYQSA